MRLHRRDLDRLMGERVEPVLVPEQELQRRQHRQHPDRHPQHGAAFRDPASGRDVTRPDREHHHGGGEIGRGHHVGEAIGKARVEYDGDPVGRIGDAVADLVPGRRLHPAVRGQDPERREQGAERHDHGRERLQPRRNAAPAEQHDPEERRFEEERGQDLVAEQGSEHVAGDHGEPAPVGAELVGQHDARHHAHGEGDREDLGPEEREPMKALLAGRDPHQCQRRHIGGEPDGEARKDDVEREGEARLDAVEQNGIEIHRGASQIGPSLTGRSIAECATTAQQGFRPGLCDRGQVAKSRTRSKVHGLFCGDRAAGSAAHLGKSP